MPHAFTLSATALRLVAPHVSVDEARPTLSCLNLEAGGLLVATDGHTLAAYPDAHDAPADLLLLADWPKLLRGKMGEDTRIEITPESEGVRFLATNPATGVVIRGTFAEGPFPSWRQVHRECAPTSGAAVAYRPHLLARFTSLYPARGRNEVSVALYGTGGVDKAYRVALAAHPTFYGLLMPHRVLTDTPTTPDFVRHRATPKGVAS